MNAGKLHACAGYAASVLHFLLKGSYLQAVAFSSVVAVRYQSKLQQNLMRLASIADAQPPPAVGLEQGGTANSQAQPQ